MIIGKGGIESGSKVFGSGGADNGTRIFGEGGELSGSYVFNKDILTATNIAILSGSQYGTIDTAVTFGAGEDFEIEIEFSSTSAGITQCIIGGVSGTSDYFQSSRSDNAVQFTTRGVSVNYLDTSHLDGKVHIAKLSAIGADLFIHMDGVQKATTSGAAVTASNFKAIGAIQAAVPSQFFSGQILSIKFTNVTTGAVRNFVLDSGSIVEQYARGSTTDKITLLNFALADWSRYTLQRNITHDAGTVSLAWVGENRVPNSILTSGRAIISDTTVTWQPSAGYPFIRFDTGLIYLISGNVTDIPSGTLTWNTGTTFPPLTDSLGVFTDLVPYGVSSADIYVTPNGTGELDITAENVSVQHLLEVV